MGVLPVPEEVRSMHDTINRIMTVVTEQNTLLQRIVGQINDIRLDNRELSAIRLELTELRSAIVVIKDCVRFDSVA